MFLKQLFAPFYKPIRHPFKELQKYLGITEEWTHFKASLRPHSGKLLFLTFVMAFPLYKDTLQYVKVKGIKAIQSELEAGQPVEILINDFVKNEVQTILKDQYVQQEAVDFVQRLAKQQKLLDSVVGLLKDSIQHTVFVEESKLFGKKLVLDLLDDKQVQSASQEMIIHVLNDPLTKYHVVEFFKVLSQDQKVKDAFVDILRKSSEDPKFREGLANALAYAMNDLLLRKETTDILKKFLLFLVQQETNQDQNIKSLMDLILSKMMTKKTLRSKTRDFDEQISKFARKPDSDRSSFSERLSGVF